jgi:hypothetical protein
MAKGTRIMSDKGMKIRSGKWRRNDNFHPPSSTLQQRINTGFITNLFLSAVFCRYIHCLVAHQSHTPWSLVSRVTLLQNISQSETEQFVLQSIGDMWHWLTHVNYNCCCYTELFRHLERFRPAKHIHWSGTCLLYSSQHWTQHLRFWLHIILSCRIILKLNHVTWHRCDPEIDPRSGCLGFLPQVFYKFNPSLHIH